MGSQGELTLEQLAELLVSYLQSGRSIPIANSQERQGNSKLWEKDVAKYFVAKGLEFARNDSISPDFDAPLNLELKTIRIDRGTKTFSVAPLTAEQALTGILPYRIAILIWRFDEERRRGIPVDAILVPKEARSVLTNWSYKGIQVKSGISESMIRQMGLLAGTRLLK